MKDRSSRPRSGSEGAEPVRLQKFISECGYASRRRAEDLIRGGKVKVNGRLVKELGTKIDPLKDRVQVRNKFLSLPNKGIVLFNKPKGVVSTLHDPEGRPCISDYLTKKFRSYFPVGRLDWDSTGLMVLTNDGEVAERLMHPRYTFDRVYHVRVEGEVTESVLQKIDKGVKLNDGMVKAQVDYLGKQSSSRFQRDAEKSSTWLEVRVTEGRNRLVRRLMGRVGYPVMKLKRVAYGPFKIGALQPGGMRPLTGKQYEKVRFKILNRPSSPKS